MQCGKRQKSLVLLHPVLLFTATAEEKHRCYPGNDPGNCDQSSEVLHKNTAVEKLSTTSGMLTGLKLFK